MFVRLIFEFSALQYAWMKLREKISELYKNWKKKSFENFLYNALLLESRVESNSSHWYQKLSI